MIRRTLGASLLAALSLATPPLAEEVTLERPLAGGSLGEGGYAAAFFYVPAGEVLMVTATFAPKSGGQPLRVIMGLEDGDSAAFSMPGQQDSLYTFSRFGEEVTVSYETDAHLRAETPTY